VLFPFKLTVWKLWTGYGKLVFWTLWIWDHYWHDKIFS
jgi:hypothetical protein